MNFAKRLCSDNANLIEVVEINIDDEQQNEVINEIFKENNFETMYRKQIEEMSANGTVGAYIRVENAELYANGDVKGGNIKINYCNALNIVPLTVINNEIIECAFTGVNHIDGKDKAVLVIFTLANGKYVAQNIVFKDDGNVESEQTIPFGDVKPFAIMRSAEVNNLEMKGYGYPKLWSAIPNLKVLDLSYTMWRRDLEKSDKIVLVNELLCAKNDKGEPKPATPQMKKIFVQLGEQAKLPEENSLWQEYNPIIRIDEATKSFELALSLLSMSFGFGTKRYTFEQGRILTATEYAGERQDSMQEINKQRSESKKYITDLANAIRWFNNSLNGTNFEEKEVLIDFDDSYVEDKQAKMQAKRNDALSFGIEKLTVWYLMEMYNLSEEEAQTLVDGIAEKDDGDGTEE